MYTVVKSAIVIYKWRSRYSFELLKGKFGIENLAQIRNSENCSKINLLAIQIKYDTMNDCCGVILRAKLLFTTKMRRDCAHVAR